MKLIIVRHGDPDYEHDTLTTRGREEAALLALRLAELPADAYYVSPLGRARATAAYTLERLGREAEELPWLMEFPGEALKPNIPDHPTIAWDWLPEDWTAEERFYSREHWTEPEAMASQSTRAQYDWVCTGLDALLERHGYRREGRLYRAERPSADTLVLFCHFGVECVMLSHLLSLSPMPLWHGFCAAPTSVTTVVTEERTAGIASFRVLCFGDTSHLTAGGLEPSFSGRFCEQFTDTTRH